MSSSLSTISTIKLYDDYNTIISLLKSGTPDKIVGNNISIDESKIIVTGDTVIFHININISNTLINQLLFRNIPSNIDTTVMYVTIDNLYADIWRWLKKNARRTGHVGFTFNFNIYDVTQNEYLIDIGYINHVHTLFNILFGYFPPSMIIIDCKVDNVKNNISELLFGYPEKFCILEPLLVDTGGRPPTKINIHTLGDADSLMFKFFFDRLNVSTSTHFMDRI